MAVRLGVIGVGAMGKHHVRILSTMPSVDLVAIADQNPEALQATGFLHIPHYHDYVDLIDHGDLDAVTIAVPTFMHGQVASYAIERGLHVLLEKPVAATMEEAVSLIELAARQGVVLAIGHVERFNPAVQDLKVRIDSGELGRLFQIEVRREGPFPARIADVGVAVDLATHDLDVLSYLLASSPQMVFAQVAKRVHVAHEDILTALMRYHSGVLATLHINWLTPTKIRQLAVTGERGMFIVDYLTQELTWYENAHTSGGWDMLNALRGVSEGCMIRYPTRRIEPLTAELHGFIQTIRGEDGMIVSGEDGVRALGLALALLRSAHLDRQITDPLGDLVLEVAR